VLEAERLGKVRAVLFYLLAGAFLLSSGFGLKAHHTREQLVLWVVMALLIAANLTPLGACLKRGAMRSLMNDETTREHRRTALAAGFWVAIAASLLLAILVQAVALPPVDVARLVATAGLCTALLVFATLELRASDG
jgi:hypothetical protein